MRPRSPRGLAVGVLALALCAALAGFGYSKFSVPSAPVQAATGDEAPAQYPETDATRLEAFTLCTPKFEYKAGFRRWTRVTPDRWRQLYPDGSEEIMNVVSRARVNDCDGSIVRPTFDANFEAFLPDKSCAWMEFLFRRLPSRAWNSYVHIEKANFDCADPR